MQPTPRARRVAPFLALLAAAGVGRSGVLAAPPAPESERWVGLRVVDPDLRRLAALDVKGPLVDVADGIPFLVIALDDEAAPVRAAARERLRALASDAVDPLLDALEAVRPGTKGGAFATFAALGAIVTPTDVAAAAGGSGPVDPPDRREAALQLAVSDAWPFGMEAVELLAARIRIGSILLADRDEEVRRTAAGALALLGLVAARVAPAPDGDPAKRGLALTLTRGQRERLVELMHHGSPVIAGGGAALAGRFGDGADPIVKALADLLEKEATRDDAAVALAELGEAARPVLPALRKHRSYGTWRALLRLGEPEKVAAGLRSKDRMDRRLAAIVLLEDGQAGEELAAALLTELTAARQHGKLPELEGALHDVAALGTGGSAALPALEALAALETADPEVRDLAAAVALRIEASLPWARARVLKRLAAPPPPTSAGRSAEDVKRTTATAFAVALDLDLVAPENPPPAPAGDDLTVVTLRGRPLGLHVAAYVLRHPAPAGPYHALLVRELDVPADKRALLWSPPTLHSFVELGYGVSTRYAVHKAALDAVAAARPFSPERRALLEALQAAPDPWLRHLAARALRRSTTK